ncbi:hypothetical protein [Ferrovum sp.]|jgi:hypothetical protein|uniref:hypothetical protein n=1 Tax=Ferrovum sp. TaxID=2609467 RepID=UPI00260BA2FE|nr:hypothetical protein [Ferrovum sp.]
MANREIQARREFNEYGYNWYPVMFVQYYNQWVDIGWVRYKRPEGFTNPVDAIHFAKEGFL